MGELGGPLYPEHETWTQIELDTSVRSDGFLEEATRLPGSAISAEAWTEDWDRKRAPADCGGGSGTDKPTPF
jgi:hypothetical protein